MHLYTSFLIAMFTAIILIPPLTFAYQKIGIVDLPSPRKVHTEPIPRVGGIAIIIATVIPIIFWTNLDIAMSGVLAGIALLFMLGILDDAKSLAYKIKFIMQMLAISIVFFSGFIDISLAYYYVNQWLVYTALLLIYFIFLLGVTNAINLADGLDGLAGGQALLSFSIIGLLAYEANNANVLVVVLAIIGAIFGFLRFNTYPAKIFMGDTGSLFLGFILGLLSIELTYSNDNAYSKALPLLLVGLPIFDTLMVMSVRLLNKKSPFNADRNHLHHKLLDRGFKHYQGVLIIYLIQSLYILAAYFMRYDSEINIIAVFLLISGFAAFIAYRPKLKKYSTSRLYAEASQMLEVLKIMVIKKTDLLFLFLSGSIFIYVVSSVILIKDFDLDISILLTGIAVISLSGLIFFTNKPCHWLERVAVHIMIMLIIYFSVDYQHKSHIDLMFNAVLLLCIGLILILFLAGSKNKFVGSPLDFLLIAVAIVIPNLPDSPLSGSNLNILMFELLVLFYCIEYVLFNILKRWWAIRTTLLLTALIPLTLNIFS